jgi:hypothetical protein
MSPKRDSVMKFEQIYGILVNHQKAINYRVVLLAKATLREIYQQFSMRRARNGLVLWYAGARLTESDLQQVADLVVSSHRT